MDNSNAQLIVSAEFDWHAIIYCLSTDVSTRSVSQDAVSSSSSGLLSFSSTSVTLILCDDGTYAKLYLLYLPPIIVVIFRVADVCLPTNLETLLEF